MNKKNKSKVKTTNRTVGMALIAIAILATVPTLNMARAQIDNGVNWGGICNQIQSILIESCGQLVNSDGVRAHDCIQNGILLGWGATLLGLPLFIVIPALKTLSGQTGCDNVVNWDSLNSGTLSLLQQVVGGH